MLVLQDGASAGVSKLWARVKASAWCGSCLSCDKQCNPSSPAAAAAAAARGKRPSSSTAVGQSDADEADGTIVSSPPPHLPSIRTGRASESEVRETPRLVVDSLQGNVFVNQYLVIKDLGRGAHGSVKLVFDTEQQEVFAMKVIRRKCAAAGAGGRRRSFSVDTPCGRGSSSPLHAPGQLLRGHSMSADVSQLLAAGWPAAGASGAAGGSAHVCASAPSWTPVDASQQPSCEGSCTLPLSRASSATPPHLSFTTAPPWPAALAISTSPSAAASRGGSPGPPAAAAAGVSAAGRQGPLPLAAALHVSTTELAREFAVMKRLSHPNVVTLHEVIHDPDQSLLVIVIEFMPGGPILTASRAPGLTTQPLPEAAARAYFRQLVSAVDYLHTNLVAHGDLKPDNLLLSAEGRLKISDFGSATLLPSASALITNALGTPAFMAPEMCSLHSAPFAPFPAEVWAVGVCLFMLVFGRVPFAAPSTGALYEAIRAPEPVSLPGQPAISSALVQLLQGLLDKRAGSRLTLEQVCHHEWVTNGGKLPPVQRCCNAPPSAAGTWLASSVEEQAQVLTALKKQVRAAIPKVEERTYKKSALLVQQGQVPEGLFLILSGSCELVLLSHLPDAQHHRQQQQGQQQQGSSPGHSSKQSFTAKMAAAVIPGREGSGGRLLRTQSSSPSFAAPLRKESDMDFAGQLSDSDDTDSSGNDDASGGEEGSGAFQPGPSSRMPLFPMFHLTASADGGRRMHGSGSCCGSLFGSGGGHRHTASACLSSSRAAAARAAAATAAEKKLGAASAGQAASDACTLLSAAPVQPGDVFMAIGEAGESSRSTSGGGCGCGNEGASASLPPAAKSGMQAMPDSATCSGAGPSAASLAEQLPPDRQQDDPAAVEQSPLSLSHAGCITSMLPSASGIGCLSAAATAVSGSRHLSLTRGSLDGGSGAGARNDGAGPGRHLKSLSVDMCQSQLLAGGLEGAECAQSIGAAPSLALDQPECVAAVALSGDGAEHAPHAAAGTAERVLQPSAAALNGGRGGWLRSLPGWPGIIRPGSRSGSPVQHSPSPSSPASFLQYSSLAQASAPDLGAHLLIAGPGGRAGGLVGADAAAGSSPVAAAGMFVVQRSANSATVGGRVFNRAMRRSESMHRRMVGLVAAAKMRTHTNSKHHELVGIRGPGQVVGDTHVNSRPAPAVTTVRARTRMRVLLVRHTDAAALVTQPSIKAALYRTQTESSVLEALESFATYDDEVAAIDEVRRSMAASFSCPMPGGGIRAAAAGLTGSGGSGVPAWLAAAAAAAAAASGAGEARHVLGTASSVGSGSTLESCGSMASSLASFTAGGGASGAASRGNGSGGAAQPSIPQPPPPAVSLRLPSASNLSTALTGPTVLSPLRIPSASFTAGSAAAGMPPSPQTSPLRPGSRGNSFTAGSCSHAARAGMLRGCSSRFALHIMQQQQQQLAGQGSGGQPSTPPLSPRR